MNDKLLFMTIFYVLAFFSFYKYFIVERKIKKMEQIEAVCTDVIVRRTYEKKYYMYYYKANFNGEEVNFSERKRLPFMQTFILINHKYTMFVSKDLKDYVLPIQFLTYKFYLWATVFLIVVPLIIFR